MKRLMILCVILTAVALIAGPAFAEVQNVKLSGDIKSTGVARENYTLQSENQYQSSELSRYDNGIITQTRIRVDADLTDNVTATVRYLTQYYWDTEDHQGSNSGTADDVDVDLANVTLKEAFYAPLTVIIGRQPLKLGTGFVLGDPDTNTTDANSAADMAYGDQSLRKSFDAVRGILDYNPLTVDIFYSKINETDAVTGVAGRDTDLWGANAAYDFENSDAEAEAYVIFLQDATNTMPGVTQTVRNAFRPVAGELITYGVRGSIAPIDNLNLLGEAAFQTGDFITTGSATQTANRDQSSFAFQVGADYALDLSWAPLLRAGYTHYQGEEQRETATSNNTADHEGWIPLFEDQTHGVIANYILGGINGGQNSNADIISLGATVEPMEDLALSIDYYNFRLDEKLVNADNTTAGHTTNGQGNLSWYNLAETTIANSDKELGYEVDIALNYDYTEDVKMGVSAGWFVPGAALEGASGADSNSETAVQVTASVDVAF